MRRWSGALLSGLIVAVLAPGAAFAATPEPSVSTSSAAAAPSSGVPSPAVLSPTPSLAASSAAPSGEAAPSPAAVPSKQGRVAAAAGCGGELVLGSPVTCASIAGTQKHTYTVRTTIDGERLLTQFHATGDAMQARLNLADGNSCFLGPYSRTCVVPEAGTHTIDVSLYYGTGSATYAIGLESQDAPSKCVTLDPDTFAVTGPKLPGKLARGAAGDCYRFDGRAGMRLSVETTQTAAGARGTADIRGWMEDPAGTRLCTLQSGGGQCTLAADGIHTIFLADMYGDAVDYTFRIVRTDVVTGCEPLKEAAFGSLSESQVAAGELALNGGYDCYAVTLAAGFKEVRTSDGGQVRWELTGPSGIVCGEYQNNGRCEVAAGDYTLWLHNTDWTVREYQAVITGLSTTEGCAAPVGTEWNQPTITFPTTPLTVYCQPFTAAPGERVIVYGVGMITDGTGSGICDQDYEQDGCLLPGSGPYRVIAFGGTTGAGELSMQIRRLSSPVGCPTITPGAYGSGPSGAYAGIRCRSLSVPAAGRYLLRTMSANNWERYGRIYDASGDRLCQLGSFCQFPEAGTYTLVLTDSAITESAYVTVFTAPWGPGCVPVGDEGLSSGAYRGSFAVVGETDCLEVDSPAGTTIDVLKPARAAGAARTDWTLINGSGEELCANYSCELTGPAPYRILLSAPEEAAPGDYAVIVQRTDQYTGCTGLPLTAIGAGGSVTTALSADRFATCYTIPASQRATSEILSYAPVSGTGAATLTVRDETGKQVCGGDWVYASQLVVCDFAAGKAYTAVIVASTANVQYRVSRRDSSPISAKCQTPASTVLGSPGNAGTVTAPDEVHCYRVTTSTATTFWLGLRSAGDSARYWISNAAGGILCSGYVVPCRVTGSTSYQVFVWSAKPGVAVPYRFDAWNLGVGGKPPTQCQTAYGVPGFGTIAGTLNDQKTAVCVAIPFKNRSEFKVQLTNTAGGEALPEPYYFPLTSGNPAKGSAIVGCSWAEGGRGCEVAPYPYTSGTALLVLATETPGGTYPFKADTTCDFSPCSVPYVLGAVSPNSAVNSGPVNLSLRGNGFSATNTVTLTRSGSASIKAAVRSFVNGTLTVTADVTNAAAGSWNVTIRSANDGRQATIAGAVTVRATALKMTKAPSISGTARVGSTVKAVTGSWSPAATGYAYQWSANGVAIKGAVGYAYQIPAAQRGKRLTVTVTAKRANRVNSPAVSAGVTVGWGIAPAATTKPKITGTVKVGKTVKAAAGAWSPSASSYRYEWRLNGKVIKGATASKLKLKKAWKGKKLTVVVIAKRAGHYDGKATSKALKIK
ncbi:hypothetical protein ACQP2E_37320 [Actinoplanes sp. CA-015351]|uniref:hypothetical protein n=1 Tax=Actinoplanes sp. CA-015351 TaxID=3239897 RepID=UPI003D99C1E0